VDSRDDFRTLKETLEVRSFFEDYHLGRLECQTLFFVFSKQKRI